VEYPVGQLTDSVQGNTLFGAGRAPVIEFDAFCEFMRFAGVPLIKNAPDDGIPFPGSRFNKADWVDDTDRVFALQRAVVDLWYHGNLDRDCEDMIEQLQRDLNRMEEDGDEEVRRSWEQAMRRLLNGPERRKIRAQHLGNS
jgi:hypothetical protein